MIVLRDYQEATVEALFRFLDNEKGNPLAALPTGTGKSVVIAEFIRRAIKLYPWIKILNLTHVKELIDQNAKTLLKMWPSAPLGVYSAGLGRKEHTLAITFAGIASAIKDVAAFGFQHLVIIDEAHLVSPSEGTMYRKLISELKITNPNLRVIGFTATHYRLGQGLLTEGDERLFDSVCFDLTDRDTFNWLIDQGYIAQLIPRKTKTELHVENVRLVGGEFAQKELQAAVDKNDITYATLKEAIELGHDRKHWLVFAAGIEHTLHVRDMLEQLGIEATCVHSKMSSVERDDNIRGFKHGRYRAMVNNGILTTGFDFPAIDLIVMLRPTASPGLWVQLLGRGTRPVYGTGFDLSTPQGRLDAQKAGPKVDCLVLDFAGNTARLGPINDPVIPRRKGKREGIGHAPVKLCVHCGTYNHASVRMCISCKEEFPKDLRLTKGASTEELVSRSSSETAKDMPVIETLRVDRVTYNRHFKLERPPALRASYFCGLNLYTEWICLEHKGYARKKARDWWRERSNGLAPPETVEDAFKQLENLRTPRKIRVWLNKKHPEVLGYEYE